MRITEPRRKVLLALLRDERTYPHDHNGNVIRGLYRHNMVRQPGVLTETGRKLAEEIAATEHGGGRG